MSAQRHRSITHSSASARAVRGSVAFAAILGASLSPSGAQAQDLAYCDLAVPQQASKLQQNGDVAVVSAGSPKKQGIRLTEEKSDQRSTTFHKLPLSLSPGQSFYQHFRMRISGSLANLPPNGADGMSFIMQNDPGGDPLKVGKIGTGNKALGISGAGLGYGGITQSLALELDTSQNAAELDPDGNHIALLLGGLIAHTSDGTLAGKPVMAQPEGSLVAPFQPIKLDPVMKSLESTTASFDTRDVWIDYECSAPNACSMKVFMTFNNPSMASQFASAASPDTLPKKPDAPVMTVEGLKDLADYLGGSTGFAGFSASTGASTDEHLVTFWILSRQPLSDSDSNNLEDACECKAIATACAGSLPICDPITDQGFCRDCLNDGECAARDPLSPICNLVATGGDGACVECTVDAHCPSDRPYCNPAENACTANCTIDDMCDAKKWCDNPTGVPFGGTCLDDLANGSPIPDSGNHTPPLDGTCTAEAAEVVCISAVCDKEDNLCGYPVGGPCTSQNGAEVCRSSVCSSANTCICEDDTDCGDATSGRVCDSMSGECSDGCRGMGGNGCPKDFLCTSTTGDVGECRSPSTGSGTPGSQGSVEGSGLFSCASGAGDARRGDTGQGAALVILAGLAGHLARRRRR